MTNNLDALMTALNKVRVTTEAIVGAVTGSLAAPRTVLLGRYDHAGSLQYTGRSSKSGIYCGSCERVSAIEHSPECGSAVGT
ncbi:hypothetical protein [Streptomyces massasporeus]|uniref:hypothetical protein n=1 Tax=Streptomyces massasporeus TaxID=67324 RepID=UPI0033D8EBC8